MSGSTRSEWPDRIRDDTRQRLAEAASRLFAERGYAATSVRDITTAAGCNLAAVNYHFGSKQELYERVFRGILGRLREQRIAAVRRVLDQAAEKCEIEAVLRAFAEAFLEPLLDPQGGESIVRLFVWEMADPHLPPQMFVEEMVDPLQQTMVEAMQRTCPGLHAQRAVMCLHSLVAQLIHVVQMRKIIYRPGDLSRSSLDTNQVVEHVVRFSAAGVRACQTGES